MSIFFQQAPGDAIKFGEIYGIAEFSISMLVYSHSTSPSYTIAANLHVTEILAAVAVINLKNTYTCLVKNIF